MAEHATTSDPQTTTFWLDVYLGDREWGNELMSKVARETLESHPDKPWLMVTVHEHGGWWLSYAYKAHQREAGRLKVIIVATANDTAVPNQDCVEWHAAAPTKIEYIGSIRR